MTLVNLDESTGEIAPIVEATPAQKVAQATEWADALMGVVNAKKLYLDVSGKRYLMVEAWELIGAFAGLRAETESVEPVKEDDRVVGYKAKVNLVETESGENRGGGAIAFCGMDEFVVKGQSSTGAKHNSAMSMAQTRATSKAFRLNFSYVASIGGYSATPAEEMVTLDKNTSSATASPAQSDTASPAQVGFMVDLGYKGSTKGITKAEASEYINKNKPISTS